MTMSPKYFRKGMQAAFSAFFVCASLLAQETDRRLVKKIEPEYPTVLKDRGIGGVVRLKVLVRMDGTIKDVQVIGGNTILVEAATKAVKQWRYAIAERETTLEITVQFDPHAETHN